MIKRWTHLVRCWLLLRIAGKMVVAINVTIDRGGGIRIDASTQTGLLKDVIVHDGDYAVHVVNLPR